MAEEPEEDDSQTISVSVAKAEVTVPIPEVFSKDSIRGRLDNGEHTLALVLTSTRLENILARGLRERLDADEEQFEALWGNETLGTYGQMCSQLGVFGDTFRQEVIDDVAGHRNELVHEYGYLSDIEEDEDLQQEIEDAIEEAIEFIGSAEV